MDEDALDKIWKCCYKYCAMRVDRQDFEDFYHQAIIGYLKALKTYDPKKSKGVSLHTFAKVSAFHAMREYNRSYIHHNFRPHENKPHTVYPLFENFFVDQTSRDRDPHETFVRRKLQQDVLNVIYEMKPIRYRNALLRYFTLPTINNKYLPDKKNTPKGHQILTSAKLKLYTLLDEYGILHISQRNKQRGD